MRDIALTLFILALLPMAFRRPFYGLVLFTWLAYMRAPDLCWGFARGIRFSFFVAIIMFIGFFLFERKKFYIAEVRNNLLVLLTMLVVFSVIVNYFLTGMSFGNYPEFAKIILVAIFTVSVVDEKWKLRVMLWTIALSLGFYGFKGGLFGMLGGQIMTGPGGLLLDNNDFSLAMVMNIPILYYLSNEEKNKSVRLFLRGTAVLTILTIVATHSRGGFLALCAVYFVMTMKSKYKLLGISVAIVAGILFIIFIPQEYVERLQSITDTKEASAASRLISWQTALNMIAANPFFGVGLGNFYYNYLLYVPGEIRMLFGENLTPHVAHNSYLQVWAECGSFAFMTFMIVIMVTLYKLRKLRKISRRQGGPSWIQNYTTALEVSIYGYLVGATFLNRALFDLVYTLIGLSLALSIIARKPSHEEEEEEGEKQVVLHIRSNDGFALPKSTTGGRFDPGGASAPIRR